MADTNMARSSTLMYWDMPLSWLVEHTSYGFVHPVSGDELARIKNKQVA